MCTDLITCKFLFIIINMDIQVNLHVSRLTT